jgi:YtfJ family uncharacterized protein
VAPVGVADRGELILDNDKFSYKNWNSSQLAGKVRVVQHIAGRSSAKEKNANLIEAIKAAGFPHDRYQTTTIVNTDDAIPGTGMFVRTALRAIKSSSHGRSLSSTATGWCVKPGSWTRRARRSWCWIRRARAVGQRRRAHQQEVQQVIDLLHKLLNK